MLAYLVLFRCSAFNLFSDSLIVVVVASTGICTLHYFASLTVANITTRSQSRQNTVSKRSLMLWREWIYWRLMRRVISPLIVMVSVVYLLFSVYEFCYWLIDHYVLIVD